MGNRYHFIFVCLFSISVSLFAETDPIYDLLVASIKSSVDAQDWQSALKEARTFEPIMGGDYRYENIISTLVQEIDTNFVYKPFPNSINKADSHEYAPVLTLDGKTLYFCGRGRPDNLGYEDIFVSTMSDDDTWSEATTISVFNSEFGSEAPETVSPNGEQMIIFKDGRLCVIKKTEVGWSNAELLTGNANISDWQADAMFSADGKVLLFAARKRTEDEKDASINIFVSLLDSTGKWGKPFSLGPTINTPYIDRSPVLHSDMRTLYFSSEGHGTLGGLDIFRSKRIGEGWTEWTTPENFGKEINSSENECWYKISTNGRTAFCSKSIDGQQDLYKMTVPSRMRPNAVSLISGKVTDLAGNPVSTTMRWTDLEENMPIRVLQTDSLTGNFTTVLPQGGLYGYYIDDERFFPKADMVDLTDNDCPEAIERNIVLISSEQMMNEGLAIALNNVFFEVDKADLLPISIPELKRLAAIINRIDYRIELSGHTDNSGGYDHNVKLSKARANTIKDFLVVEGCDASRFETKGYGPDRPISTNETPEGRQLNRRVEMRFLPKE